MRFLLLSVLLSMPPAHAFPIAGKPVRIVVPLPPGGQTDIQARVIAQKMGEGLGAGVIEDLVVYARANPGKLNYASFCTGTTSHLNGELFKRLAGIDIVHVPYKGSGDAMKDHLTGAVQLFFDGPTTAIANAKTGKVKLVATAAETRKAALPEVPTMREAGYDVGMWGYLWFWGPGGMAPDTLDALHRQLARAVEHPEVKELFAKGGSEAMALPPAEMMRVSRDLHDRWGTIIRSV